MGCLMSLATCLYSNLRVLPLFLSLKDATLYSYSRNQTSLLNLGHSYSSLLVVVLLLISWMLHSFSSMLLASMAEKLQLGARHLLELLAL